MPDLRIDIETPGSFADIDFAAMAEHFQRPIDVITDLEGTVLEWGYRPRFATIDPEVLDVIQEGANETIVGAHSVTNHAGQAGRFLTRLFADAVTERVPYLDSFGESPTTRNDRKPSGTMSQRIIKAIHEWRVMHGTDESREEISDMAVAWVGDKTSDMREAESLHHRTGITVVGFMVERLGTTDHPLDTVFGKRRQATAAREAFAATARNRFVR